MTRVNPIRLILRVPTKLGPRILITQAIAPNDASLIVEAFQDSDIEIQNFKPLEFPILEEPIPA